MPFAIGIALIAYAAYVLVGVYYDVLITAQDRNAFVNGSQFFCESISQPFGIFQYAGAFLTQLFYQPSLGAGILIALWTAIVLVGMKSLRLDGVCRWLMILPAACLMSSIVDLGYWIYCLKLPGYWFSQSVAYLCLMLLLWVADATPRRFRIVWHVLIGFAAFPLFGWFSYLFTVTLLLMQCRKGNKPSWLDAVGVILSFLAPLVFRAVLYQGIPLNDVYTAGFPVFKTFTDESLRPSMPFFLLSGITLLLALSRAIPQQKELTEAPKSKAPSRNIFRTLLSPAFGVAVAAVSAYAVWDVMFKDDNYIYEMQMTQATMDDDWQRVISVTEQTKTPSRTMVMLKNIALMNTGELGERSFELSNSGVEINNPDSLNVNIMQIAAPVIYYNYGKINYAMRWCMEFAVSYNTFSPYYLRTLIRCAQSTGEKELAARYLNRLHRTMFYAEWQPAAETPVVRELRTYSRESLDSDENSCERYLISLLSISHNANSPVLSELGVFYSMIVRTPNLFWTAFYDYASTHKGKKLPSSYAEACCIFKGKQPEGFPFDVDALPETMARYKAFMDDGNRYANMGFSEQGVADAMDTNWGHTYWWFNAFGRSEY